MKIVQLTEVAKPINNSVKSFDGERFYVATKTLQSNTIELKYSEKVDFTNKPSRANQEVDVGDIVFAKMQGTRKTLLITDIEKDYIFSSGFFVLRTSELILPEYLFHFLNSSFFLEQKDRHCTGATQKALTLEGLKKVYIPLPSLQTQKEIIAKLDRLTNIIELRKKSIAKTEQLTKSIFIEMFGDPVLNDKEFNLKTIEELVSKEKYSLKRGPFGGALKKEIFVDSGYLVYEQFHALNNDFTFARYFINDEKFEELKTFEVKAGDIIISCSGIYLGKLAIIPENHKKGIINQALLKLTLDENLMNKTFFLYIFTDINFKNKYFGSGVGSGIPNFPPMSEFKKFEFIYPPISLQNKFAEIVKINEENIRKQKDSLESLEELYASCMQESFRF